MPTALEDTGMRLVRFLLFHGFLTPCIGYGLSSFSADSEHLVLQGADCVSAYVTHGVFPNESWRRFTKCNGTADAFKFFWITDSCPRTVQAIEGQAPYEIISLAGPIMAALQI